MVHRPQKRIKKEKASGRWAFSLSVSFFVHAVAAFAVPGFPAIHEKINLPVLEHFIFVDVSRQQEAAPEAGLTAASEVGLRSVEKEGPPFPAATEPMRDEGVVVASAGPEGATGERASAAGDAFARTGPDGEVAAFEGNYTSSQGDPATLPGNSLHAGKRAFVSYTGNEGAGDRFAPGLINISAIGGGRQSGVAGNGPGAFASVEKAGAVQPGKAGMAAEGAWEGAASGFPASGSLSGKGRPVSMDGSGDGNETEAGPGRPAAGGKALSIGKVPAYRAAGSPALRAAGLRAPEEARGEITIISPADNSTFDALSCGDINISGSVKGGGDRVRVCLNGKIYAVEIKKGFFNLKVPPEAEENLLFAEKTDGDRVLCRSKKVYFRVLNIDPGELAVFADIGGGKGSLRFRCSWKPHPLAGMRSKWQEPEYEIRGTHGETVSVMKVTPGIYTIGLDYDSPACEVALRVYLYSREPARRKSRGIPLTLSGKGYLPAVRVLLPEGVFWEDDSWFSGTFENSREVTKFRQPEGIVWKEEY